jgi:2-polyprenyl-3-methyl-5-hydroxy-6-metoxy-1,4-benzoquinol methylase
MEQLDQCLACGAPSSEASVVYRRQDDNLVRCPSCRLVYANPQYTPDELTAIYDRDYYDDCVSRDFEKREQDWIVNHRPLNAVVVGDLLARYPSLRGARVLDYGCGPGFFLKACLDAGMTPMGIDFSPAAASYARERFGLDVRSVENSSLSSLGDGTLDLVTAWQVVEHLRRPRETLTDMVRVLRPGGVLAIAVPNLGCWRHRVEGARWFNIQNRTHLAFFDPQNLAGVLAGLGMIDIIRPVFWGGRGKFGPLANLAQFVARLSNLGSEFRLYATKPASAVPRGNKPNVATKIRL